MNRVLMSLAVTAALVLWPTNAVSKTITVVVIDTGIDKLSNDKLCKYGHKSFVPSDPNPLVDSHGHGTHIAGLIRKEAGLLDYCIVSVKFYSEGNSGKQNLVNMVAALNYANNIKADFINISGGGPEFFEEEWNAIKKSLDRKATVVVAAGNEKNNLDEVCNYYPACYDKRIVMVGNLFKTVIPSWVRDLSYLKTVADMIAGTPTLQKAPSSNYGKRVTRWEIGTDVESVLPNGKHGKLTGTSQATGVATGKLIRERFL